MKISDLGAGPRKAWEEYLAEEEPAKGGPSYSFKLDLSYGVMKSKGKGSGLGGFLPALLRLLEGIGDFFRSFRELGEGISRLIHPKEITADQVKAARDKLKRLLFWLGPIYPNDLRRLRPYFLVPLGDAALPGEVDLVLDNIRAYAKGQAFTDLYVLSHGWHRNLLSGVAAYDRLVSRFSLLAARGRLAETAAVAPPEDFKPLFIALHWNSDPGDDSWVDKSGRRHKDSFIENCRDVFGIPATGSETQFLADFENLFEFMSQISVAEVDTLGPEWDASAAHLIQALAPYEIRCAPATAPLADKVSAIWRCYFETKNKALLTDQGARPRPIGGPLDALSALAKFVIGAAGIGIVTSLVPLDPIKQGIVKAWVWLVARFLPAEAPFTLWQRFLLGLALYAVATAALALVFYFYTRLTLWMRSFVYEGEKRKLSGTPVITALLWFPLQILATLPVLVGLLCSFVFRTNLVLLSLIPGIYAGMWWWSLYAALGFGLVSTLYSLAGRPVPGLYDERPLERGLFWRNSLAGLARTPIRWLRDLLAPDASIMRLAETLDSQFAFFEMQQKGCNVGCEAGEFLGRLMAVLEGTPEIHLVGHSFGGLVVCNAARTYLASHDEARIRSVCLIQGAIASNWFEKELGTTMIPRITGAITCIYSRYDTANGFYSPAANNGRLAAGYIGLCRVPGASNPPVVGQKGAFAMLVRPPNLASMAPPSNPYVVNLDASRLIYEGGIALGGGHDDIFKDDVVNLMWSATRIGP